MLPNMFTNTKRNLIAGVTAAAVLVSGAAPAMAWGKNEQQFLAGVVTTLAVTQLIANSPKYGNRAPVYQQAPVYQPAPQPRYRYYRPAPQRPVYYEPAPVSIYGTPDWPHVQQLHLERAVSASSRP